MQLPNFRVLQKNYNTSPDTKSYLHKIGGGAANLPNSCVVRVSEAFNLSGKEYQIMEHFGMEVVKGADGLFYGKKVMQMETYLNKKYPSTPKLIAAQPKQMNAAYFKLNPGIIAFFVDHWGDARGHFTLWDGFQLAYQGDHNYWTDFKLGYDKKILCIERIVLWKCKL